MKENLVTFKVSIGDQYFEIRQTSNNKFYWYVVSAWIKIDSFSQLFETEKECYIDLYETIVKQLA